MSRGEIQCPRHGSDQTGTIVQDSVSVHVEDDVTISNDGVVAVVFNTIIIIIIVFVIAVVGDT